MNNQKTTKTENKISQLKLEVIRFNSSDVIATSGVLQLMVMAGEHEFMANFTIAQNFTDPSTTNTAYSEPTAGQ